MSEETFGVEALARAIAIRVRAGWPIQSAVDDLIEEIDAFGHAGGALAALGRELREMGVRRVFAGRDGRPISDNTLAWVVRASRAKRAREAERRLAVG